MTTRKASTKKPKTTRTRKAANSEAPTSAESLPNSEDQLPLPGVEADEAPEGIENYPLDSLLMRIETRSVQDVLRRIADNTIILNPDFQRAFVWPEDKQSKLIESVLMRIPLQSFYVAENLDGNLVSVDGLQRLTTFNNFHRGMLHLDLESRPELNGKTFATLDGKLRRRFEDGQLTFIVISAQVPERVRLDIFERVNGGTPLTRQQMRNAIYNGPATRMLSELADHVAFKTATGGALSGADAVRRMKDREAINRYMAHRRLGYKAYTSYDDHLANGLRECNKAPDKLSALKDEFLRSMQLNQEIFGKHAYRKSLVNPDGDRLAFNMALWEVFSVCLAPYKEIPPTKIKAIVQATKKLLAGDLKDAVSWGTAKPANVQKRFEAIEAMLLDVVGPPASAS